MWDRIANVILKKRITFIAIIAVFTAVMGFFASKAELGYDNQKLVPADDPDYKIYLEFKKTFGEDGNKIVIGFKNKNLFNLKFYTAYQNLCNDIAKKRGISDVVSPARVYNMSIDTNSKFAISQIAKTPPANQTEMDSIAQLFKNLKFYDALLYNDSNSVALAVVGINDEYLNSEKRTALIQEILAQCDKFGQDHKLEMHYSGLPFIRNEFMTNVRREIVLFTVIAFFVTALLILVFFRNLAILLISIIFITIGVVTMAGITGLLGYKITILTGTLPPVLVVVGVQNAIYLINKYHEELRRHNNKARALSRIISRVGVANFLVNFTTAIGFGTFYFTKTLMLEQFGIVSFLTINALFFINIIGIPIVFSFLKTPSQKQTEHLENKNITNFLSWTKFYAFNHKRRIYFWTIATASFSAIFIIKLKPLAFMVDDIPHSSKVYRDLEFFQHNFRGVMPYEVIVSTNEPGYAAEAEAIVKVNSFQKAMKRFPEFSKPMSVAEVISFANQTYHEGDPRFYRVPNVLEMASLQEYFPQRKPGAKHTPMDGMIDTGKSKLRISYQMKDIGSIRMDSLSKDVKQLAESIFPKEDYDVKITGTSAIFLKGNGYLYGSLVQSTFWALLIISLTMGLLFPSIKMIIISVIPNILPLLVTGGIMGYFQIPLKPSTILVFSIAFGISVDATIHFMSTFRRHLLQLNQPVREALSHTIMEVGMSMIYTNIALFCGFMIFVFSRFQGTQSLGWLTAVTLLTGLVANLFLLPALLLSFEKSLNAKEEMKEVVLELPEED